MNTLLNCPISFSLQTKLFFFPEGTRNVKVNKSRQLLPFKKGAFKLAISYQVPILPIVFSPYYFIDSEKRYFGQGSCKFILLHLKYNSCNEVF